MLISTADAILSHNYQTFLMTILSPPSTSTGDTQDDIPPAFLAAVLDRLIQDPPRNWSEESKTGLSYALHLRYQKLGILMPTEISSTMQLIDLLGTTHPLVRLVQRHGPKGTASLDACKEMLASAETRDISYQQVASVLLFMVIAQGGQAYNPAIFVAALREHRAGQRIDWQDVVHSFDRHGLRITKQQFLTLYNALFPLAQEYENFDLQLLWGNMWAHSETQLSFVVAFSSCGPDELDASLIPRLRRAFTQEDFDDASDEVKSYAAKAVRHPLVSLDATTALFSMIFRSQETYNHAQSLGIPETVINANTDIFIVSASAVPKPWGGLQDQALKQLFYPFLSKSLPNFNFVLHGLWKQDSNWLAARLIDTYTQNPMTITLILEHALEHGWLNSLIAINNEMSVDLAALSHGRGLFDLEPWAQQHFQLVPTVFARVLSSFLANKAEDDLQVQRENLGPTTVRLAVKTVHPLLGFLQGHLADEELVQLQRTCIQAYPRLINYGEGFDEIIDANGKDTNAVAEEADAKMQEHYKKMYSMESDVRDIIEALQKYKTSEDPADQDLFACMIHGLFDEYNCFGEYPLEALATTAVLFGGIINYNLLSRIALQAGLAMVLESVQEYRSEDSMYKFGLQALLHFANRLQEWPSFCDRLLRVPGLQGTEIWAKAEEIVKRQPNGESNGDGQSRALVVNGNTEEFLTQEPAVPNFTCIHADPPLRPELYEEPDEDVQDKVLFVLNNVSERNLETKLRDLRDVLEDKHHQWFASYLVEERAKMQPNFQQLYLDMLDMIDDRVLWAEVLRETYVAVVRMLNAESTLSSSAERAHLKNLGGWLGSLTIARDKPIKFKNISFKDLLIEAHDTQRLIIVIPFTCKVLLQAQKSTVFKPPNPWIMEIVHLLLELYHFAELKLNLKFEVEVLCKGLELDYRAIEPSDSIRSRPLPEEEFLGAVLADGMEGFNDLSLMGLHRGRGPNERFSPAAVTAGLPDLGSLLIYPPSSTVMGQSRIKQIFLTAAQQAVAEIIAPVVERSVTIAAISASQLVAKDFAMELDETKILDSAHNVVKALSGSLALVTCKEPLRMSVTNNIRLIARDLPEQALPEGSILMFVNDNLDTICGMVEQAAENHSTTEIDMQLEDLLRVRRLHRSTRPNEPFMDPILSRWSFFIPEPYRQAPGGLNREQMATYEFFGRQTRPFPNHNNSASQDSGRQVSDIMQDSFPAVPNLPTPAEPANAARPALQQQQRLPSAPSIQMPLPQRQINGYVEPHSLGDRVNDLLAELHNAAREAPESHIKDLGANAPAREIYEQLMHLIDGSGSQRDVLSVNAAGKITNFIYTDTQSQLEAEIMVQLLTHLCQLSVQTARQVIPWLTNIDDDRIFNAMVTVCLVNAGIVDLHRVDMITAKALHQRKLVAAEFLSDIADIVLVSDNPNAFRADFANAFEAMTQWLIEEPELEVGKQIMAKLQAQEGPNLAITPSSAGQDQLEYIFEEWVHLQNPETPEQSVAAFIHQLHQGELLADHERSALFMRFCVELALAAYEQEESAPYGNLSAAYLHVDALSKLIVSLVVYHGEADRPPRETKAAYFEGMLSLIVLVICHQHQARDERFNQKVFFRLFSSIVCEMHRVKNRLATSYRDLMLVMGRALLALQPKYFPGFAFGWLALVSHRLLMPALLKMTDESLDEGQSYGVGVFSNWLQGWEMYTQLIETLLAFAGDLAKERDVPAIAKDYYRGVLRVLLVLHHDFPEFLAENYFRLCSSIPTHCTQLRNLVVSAYPSSFPELPDPFTAGLKVDRLEEIRKAPVVRGDIDRYLERAQIKGVIEDIFQKGNITGRDMDKICDAVYHPQEQETGLDFVTVTVDRILLHAMVLYIGTQAITAAGPKGPTFNATSIHVHLLEQLVREFRPEARYHLISAIVNQLRYPNSHTHYFSYAILHLFGSSSGDDQLLEVQQQITRVLLERLIVHRPHPWGLIITLLEILKNPNYSFWDLPFIKAAPEVRWPFFLMWSMTDNFRF